MAYTASSAGLDVDELAAASLPWGLCFIPAIAVIAPFVCNLSFATSSTPTNSSTYTGCALTETDVQHYCKKAVPVQTVTNAVVILAAVIFHVLKL